MTVTFINARLIDPVATTQNLGTLTIDNGQITAINQGPQGQVIDCNGKFLAPGIVDIGVKIGEPGERHKESLRSAGRAAAAGGVTTMVIRPDTAPAIDSPETLSFVARRAQQTASVNIKPMAALTKERAGREMVEMGFLRDAGAVAFSDCDKVVENNKVLVRAMSYAASLGALVVGHPQEPILSDNASVTSGKFATLRGLPAVSPLAERMGLERDLALVEMTSVAYHADNLSTAGALEVLARAKKEGLNVSAGVNIHHLTFNEFDVGDYRTFFKLKPPLRCEDDRLAMVHAVASGLIDIISSMHTPQDEESKRLPFEEAASGAVALETLLPAALRLVHSELIDLPTLWRALSLNPARRFGLDGGDLAPGSPADLVLFDADRPFVMNRFKLQSKSKNTPFDGARMQGMVLGTWVAGQQVFGGADA